MALVLLKTAERPDLELFTLANRNVPQVKTSTNQNIYSLSCVSCRDLFNPSWALQGGCSRRCTCVADYYDTGFLTFFWEVQQYQAFLLWTFTYSLPIGYQYKLLHIFPVRAQCSGKILGFRRAKYQFLWHTSDGRRLVWAGLWEEMRVFSPSSFCPLFLTQHISTELPVSHRLTSMSFPGKFQEKIHGFNG